MIRPHHLDLEQGIPDAIAGALAKTLTPRSGMRLGLTVHLTRVGRDHLRLYLVPEMQTHTFLNAYALTKQLDRLDHNLAPSLLALVDRAHHLTPSFTPSAAYDTIVNLHWGGDDTGEEALEELRWQLAQERNVEPDTIPIEEAKALANDQFLTPDTLEPRLPRRYYEANAHTIQTPEILARLEPSLIPGALGETQALVQAANEANRHAKHIHAHDLSDWEDENLYSETMQWYAYMVSITDPRTTQGEGNNEFNDVTYETLYEYDQYVMQGGSEPAPTGAYLIPHTPGGLRQLADLVKKLRRQLALETRVYDLLAALAAKAGASEADRTPTP